MSTSADVLLERVRAATEDEYTIEGELGRGGMAAVFLARDIALERRVAIKVMLPDLVDMAGIQDRFVIEARTAAHLDHPGIVTVYSVKQRSGLLFIVMKYVEGRTLESILRSQEKLDPGVVTTLVGSVAEALHFAHAEGVIHRDVKPSNIIIDKRGRPIVTDFGIAKVTASRSITVTGSMLGTPAYMSPEQCRGLPATAASDQYSLGVMTYEMLSGKLPFYGTIFELIHAHCYEQPKPLEEVVSGLEPALLETVTRMMAKSPPERWPTLSDVAKRLGGARHRQTSEVQASIVALAAGDADVDQASRRTDVFADLSSAATELATTPAPGLVVTPHDPTIEIGQTVQMRVSEASGASLAGVRIMWRSEDQTIATIDEKGLVTGKSVGFAKITATAGAAIGRIAVTVKAPSVDTLVVTPQSPELITENEIQFVATVLDSRGTTLAGQAIVWQSSNVAVCAVSGQGRAIGIAPGKATITAICGEVQGTAQVRVRLPAVERVVVDSPDVSIETEETRRLNATVYGAQDRKLAARTVTWRSTVPTVATVDAEGTVKGVSPGTAAIVATCDGKEGLVSVGVRAQPIVAVRVQPAQLQLETGRSLQLKGVGEDRRGRPAGDAGIEWRSDDDEVAIVDASGKVHAVSEGRTHVRAQVGDVTSAIEVTVVPRPAAQIRIEPHQPSLAVGEFLTLDATALDAEGVTLGGREVTWTTSDAKVVEINTSGVCEAKRPGAVRITAACEKARATTKLSVSPAATAAAGAVPLPAEPRASASGDKRAAATEVISAVTPAAPRRNIGRLVTIGSALTILVVAGIFIVTRGRGGAGASAGGATGTQSKAPDTSASIPSQRPADVTPPVTKEPGAAPGAQDKRPGADAGAKQSSAANAPQTARGNANQATGASQGNPPVSTTGTTTQKNPPGGAQQQTQQQAQQAANQTARGGAAPPVRPETTATKQQAVVPPPPVNVTPPVTPPTGRSEATGSDASRAVLCSNDAKPANLLTDALSSDPAAKIGTLYVPRDAADTKAKADMLGSLKDAQKLRATARAVRNEPAGESCDWIMVIDLNWATGFGTARKHSYQVRMQLDLVNSKPQVKHFFDAKGQ